MTLPVGVESWEDLTTLAERLPGWVFRGQCESCWRLESTLERFVGRQARQIPLVDAEQRILDEFQRGASRWLFNPPSSDDAMSWLSIIQHYGGPTRLLDLTLSLPVAVFFALENEPKTGRCVVWAINDIVVRGKLADVLVDAEGRAIPCKDALAAGNLLNLRLGAEFSGPAAAAGVPRLPTERQRLQEGLYLFGLNLDYSLEQNLYGMFDIDPADVYPETLVGWFTNPLSERVLRKLRRRPVIKIFVNNQVRPGVLDELGNAGVSRATLFPEDDYLEQPVQDELNRILQDMVEELRTP